MVPYYILAILHPFIRLVWFFPYKSGISWYESFGSMAGHHRHGNNVEKPKRDHQDFEMEDLWRKF